MYVSVDKMVCSLGSSSSEGFKQFLRWIFNSLTAVFIFFYNRGILTHWCVAECSSGCREIQIKTTKLTAQKNQNPEKDFFKKSEKIQHFLFVPFFFFFLL